LRFQESGFKGIGENKALLALLKADGPVARSRQEFIRLTHFIWSLAFSVSVMPSASAICFTSRRKSSSACRMEKYITDERTGLKYELVGDYYLIAGDDEPEEERPIGIWGQRHLRYLIYQPKKKLICLSVNIRKIGVQFATCQQSGISHTAMLLEIAEMPLSPYPDWPLFQWRH